MGDVLLKLKPEQLKDTIKNLSWGDKTKILRFLEDITWGKRFDAMVKTLKNKTKKISMNVSSLGKNPSPLGDTFRMIKDGKMEECNFIDMERIPYMT